MTRSRSFWRIRHLQAQSHLRTKNKELGQVDSELALPPDTGYQRITPGHSTRASTIRVDSSGNWLARYTLKPQELQVSRGYATVYPVPLS